MDKKTKKLIKKYYPVASASLVAVIVAMTALGIIPQKPGIAATFIILGVTNFMVALTVWRHGKKLEAGFLGSASIIVLVMIVVYIFVG